MPASVDVVSKVNLLMHEGFEIPLEKLTPNATIFGDLGLDSLDAVDMLVNLEDKIGVKVEVERIKAVRTMQDIYDLVESLSTTPGMKTQLDQ
ncbi:MAG TPA: acyl carrier protein [Bdellovibrionales bacterium]|nr:acyl carrier protein [Bdellovibrionales bacterium]